MTVGDRRANAWQFVLRQREIYIDRPGLVDNDHFSRAVISFDEIARMELEIAGTPFDRRIDRCIAEVDARGLDRGLIGGNSCSSLGRRGVRLIGLLARADALLEEVAVPPFIGLGLKHLRAVALELGL